MIDARSREASLKRRWLVQEIETLTGMDLEILRHKLVSGYRIVMPETLKALKDSLPVTRCKDCGYYHIEHMVCDRPCEHPVIRDPDDFCSGASRRD